MPTTVLSTAQVSPRERVPFWREVICETYVELSCECPRDRAFDGSITLRSLPGVDLSNVDASAQTVSRGRREIAASSDEYFLMSVQLAGSGVVVQRGREARLAVGDAALYTSTEPYELRFGGDFAQLVARMPKRSTLARIPGADDLTATRIGNGTTRSLVTLARELTSPTESSNFADGDGSDFLAAAVTALVCADIATLAGERGSEPAMATWRRIRSCMERNVSDPGFGRNELAAEMRLSVRRINEILALRGSSITRELRALRLEGARAELARSSGAKRRVADVAARWGFEDPAAFARAFRGAYGTAPSHLRSGDDQRNRSVDAHHSNRARPPF